MKKKNLLFVLGGLFLMAAMVSVKVIQTDRSAVSSLKLANIEALADDEPTALNCSDEKTCPNGGQITKGVVDQKQKKYEVTADSNGKVTYGGATKDMGAEYASQKCFIIVAWAECDYDKDKTLNCCSCNSYILEVTKE
jgi:hypothetical protein